MPTYALLGATGATGSAVLRSLIKSPPQDLRLNLLVRSRSKLENKFPALFQHDPPLSFQVFEGSIPDGKILLECLQGVDVIMACVATNVATRDMSIAQDTAKAIIDALETNKTARLSNSVLPPTVIQLRSASLNPTAKSVAPWIGRNMAAFCFYYIYADLASACELFEAAAASETPCLTYIYVDPPSIHDADGTTPTGYKLLTADGDLGQLRSSLSYADLGSSFCELAERRTEFVNQAVAVTATGTVKQTWGSLVGFILQGASTRIFGS